jgi:hypothetical protein
MSATRPDVSAGPMERSASPEATVFVSRALSVRGGVCAVSVVAVKSRRAEDVRMGVGKGSDEKTNIVAAPALRSHVTSIRHTR